jgi:hypothetical protein
LNLSLFPLSAVEIDFGFEGVVARFRALESEDESAGQFCDLGEEGEAVENLLLGAGAGDLAGLAVSGGDVLGDDRAGTLCTHLSVEDVRRVSAFLAGVSVESVMARAPEFLSGVIRGMVPQGYLEDLAEYVIELRDIFRRADREGLCMVHIYEG